MKKLLYQMAVKMEPGIIQNLILRMSSKTPKMFHIIQIYSGISASVFGSLVLGLENHKIPDFKHESIVIDILKLTCSFLAAVTVSMSTHTDSEAIHEQSNQIQ